jgi:hypothetical protein
VSGVAGGAVDIPDFRKAFRGGASFRTDFLGEFHVERRPVGRMIVPTGRLVACDPLVFPETRPFRKRVPPGKYPVVLSIAHIRPRPRSGADERLACAMLCLSSRSPQRRQMAVKAGQRLAALKRDEFYGYVVDSGTGCFMDYSAAKLLERRMRRETDFFLQIIDAKKQVYKNTRSWVDFPLDDSTGLNLIAFSTGFGDGTYASYWGYDSAGEVACLVTDFDILERTTPFTTVREVK